MFNQAGYNIFSGPAKDALDVFNIVSDKLYNYDFSTYAQIDPFVLLEASAEKESFWKTLGRVKSKLKVS